jgi:hypothetical protein
MKRFASFLWASMVIPLILLSGGCAETGSNYLQMANLLNTPEFYYTAYKVGLICSLSGPYASTGTKQAEEIAVFVENVNARGGIYGHKLYILGPYQAHALPQECLKHKEAAFYRMRPDGQVANAGLAGKYLIFSDALVYDSRGEKAQAIKSMHRLIKKNVLAILGPTLKSTAMELAPLAENAKIPLIYFQAEPGITPWSHQWSFGAEPLEAVSTAFNALRVVGPDRRKIRSYLETHLSGSTQ